MDRTDNALMDFTAALGSEVSATNEMAYNRRYGVLTLNRSLLTSLYIEDGIIQVLIDQPVDDAFRKGIIIHCDELDGDDIKLLQSEIERLGVIETYKQGLKWARLFGGAGILVNIGQDLEKPLNIKSIKEETPLKFYAVDRWELSYAPEGMGVLDQFYTPASERPYNYYGHNMHYSNIIKLMGKEPPSLLRGQFGGWGMSEMEKVVRSYNAYLKHQNVTFELLDEARVDVFSISGFNSAISTKQGAQKTAERIQAAARIKNFQNALVIDSEDKHDSKQIAFAGLSEILKEIRIGLACDLRMPMTKLFGISASGFNSGEDDIENYNCMIETEIRSKNKQPMISLLAIVCQKTFGFIPESIDFDYHPLREMTNQESSQKKNDELTRVVTAFNTGFVTSEKAVEIINNAKVFDIELSPDEAMSYEEMKSMTAPKEQNETSDKETKDA